ncbi:transcription termination factor Rho [Roseibacillus ishigakijimensis]|uniref:Transcription termination factor Rho n=1 Tax=Roseibacillus ishigakijimensis TaxID=454146 RepID=A0A934VM83_9BACT|nr:transcription termination factor Rho [Roseibacillus ishigakijimensis]MBK1834002.1 transcription termination factor Rho [Roseibacillus ishigakijimensis]
MADEIRELFPSDSSTEAFDNEASPAKKTATGKKKATTARKVTKKATKKTAKKATKKTAAKKAAAKKGARKKATKKASEKNPAEVPEEKATAPKATEKAVEAAPPKKKASPARKAIATPARAEKASEQSSPPAKKAAKKAAARKILAVPEDMKARKEKEPAAAETPPVPEEKKEEIPRRDGRPMGRVKGGPVGKAAEKVREEAKASAEPEKSAGEKKEKPAAKDTFSVSGLLETTPKGFGFLREPGGNYEQSKSDVFVPPDLVQTHALRAGQVITGEAQQGARGPQLVSIRTINGHDPEAAKAFPHFDELKAIFPEKRIGLETTPERFTTRVLDILAPVGRGQRGLIVSPPRAGKTTLLLHIAEAVQELHSETLHLMVCLVDERPEEVTEFRRQLPDAEIYASSNDEPARNHCRLAELCIERAKRLVEAGQHVFLVMDSITRLARAYNNTMGGNKKKRGGRGIQSGGIMAGALEQPRRLFAAARNTREAGSLTILGTALVQTNSKADEAIFMEFKGTGNMELVLDRRIAEHFVYPAVDLFKSGTRREELLLPEHTLHKINLIRRGLAGHRPIEAMERLLFFLKKFPNNAQMLMEIKG